MSSVVFRSSKLELEIAADERRGIQRRKRRKAELADNEGQGKYLSGGRRRRPKRDIGNCGNGTAGGTEGLDGVVVEDGEELVVAEGEETGADTTGEKQGFNLSTETVQGLPARTNTNVLSFLSRTLKGPT